MALLTVLAYHRIDDPDARPELDPALISASPSTFRRQLAWLAANAAPVSLEDALAARAGRAQLPPRAVLVTFDDAYRDFAEHAWPALRAYGIPVTLFVPTAYPGAARLSFWWDRLYQALTQTRRRDDVLTPVGRLSLATARDRLRAHRALVAWVRRTPHREAMHTVHQLVALLGGSSAVHAVLGWPELRRMAADGVVLAPHSRSHACLDRVSLGRARRELAGSREDLVREIGRCPPAFAFPSGAHGGPLARLLEEEGFELAFTMRRGANDLSRPDWLSLRRCNVGRRSTTGLLRAEIGPWTARAVTLVAGARQ